MRGRYLCILLCLYALLPLSAKEFYFKHVDLNDVFTQPSAISIYQDAKGYIWFGNDNFNVYDGRIVRSFRLSDYLEEVEDNNIHGICGDGDSCIYMLANRNLVLFNQRTEEFRFTTVLAHVLEYHQGTLFYADKNELYHYTPNGVSDKVCTLPDSTLVIRDLHFKDGGWLLATTKGLYRYSNGTCWNLLENESITSLFVDNRGRLWVGTLSNGAKVFCEGEWVSFRENDSAYPIVNNQVRTINQDIKGNIWIGTYAGITVVSPSLQDCYHLSHKEQVSWSLKHSSVYAIFRDQQGGMWVGTYYGGLSYFNPNTDNYTFYDISPNSPESLDGFLFGQMAEDMNGNLYIATEHGRLNCLDRTTQKVKRYDPVLSRIPSPTTKSVWYDVEHDRLYIGTFLHGLYCYSSGRLKQLGTDVLQDDGQQIIMNLIPWQGNLIVITQTGLYQLDLTTQQLSPLFSDPDLLDRSAGIIRSAWLDDENRLWLTPANKDVLCIRMDTRTVEEIPSVKNMIGKKPVLHITGDNRGNLYFAVTGTGVLRYDLMNDFWTCYNQEQGHLLTNEPFRALVTPMGRLLVTSIRGITLLDMKTGKSMHTLLGTSFPLHRLNSNCGIYLSPKDSMIFIGGVEGMIATKESGLVPVDVPYSISFNSLSVNNIPIHPSASSSILKEAVPYVSSLTLPHDRNNITLGFTSTNYRYADKNLFEYKLEGLDKQWTRTRHQQIVYTSIPPGNYKLLLREAGDGKLIAMPIRVRPPFYASVYAFSLYALLFFLFLVWLIRFNRSRAVLKASLEMEHREKLRIEKLNQMKLKFYINISHELRTPLTLMVSQVDLILQNYDLGGTFRGKLLKVRQYTVQMQQLITEVLDFRRLEQGKMPLHASPQNLVVFMRQLFDSFKDYAVMNRIQYRLETMDEEIPVWFDPVQIRKVFNNLLSNAFKFTPKEGTVMVSILRKKGVVEIRISDTGSGIPQSQLAHIFERFYQADNATGVSLSGSGIGLSLTQEIIMQHKGQIEVKSELGVGTTFTVTLRLGDEHLTPEQKSTEVQPAGILPVQELKRDEIVGIPDFPDLISINKLPDTKETEMPLSVLLVEDNEDLLQVLEEAFSIQYKVYKACDGEEGIRMAEEVQPDLIISDVMMPGISGTVMCQRLKRKLETSHIPIILLTARVDLESALDGLKCGANDYIMKPFNINLLLLKCHNIIADLKSYQTRFCTEAASQPVELATNRLDQQLLDDSVRIIEENMENQDFSIDMWCREIAIGRTRLGMKIKAITGLTLNDFIIQIKLRKCAYLLETTDLTIAEISWKTGFSSSSYMGKNFKDYFGVTPLQYKKAKNASS
ncbi:ATP-binding protein [Parabacteroides sp. W1-Q-101]|uniref:hybrid sensor histidine kinase/response regulator transcription factor n=1 Tax=Parabacteroides TaxID=375288 RepID=UPI001FBB5404|nr:MULTISPECIES: hybrid sensor histidine kinase/response regulator transcription factor [Parabacteroides]MCM0717177.1 ATP-binding protein [Parabacteroides sp. W1-Q-101]